MTDAPTNTSAREAIARVLHPGVFCQLDNTESGARIWAKEIAGALAEADAILALPQIVGPMEAASEAINLAGEIAHILGQSRKRHGYVVCVTATLDSLLEDFLRAEETFENFKGDGDGR